jgi:hypothetical protein
MCYHNTFKFVIKHEAVKGATFEADSKQPAKLLLVITLCCRYKSIYLTNTI